MSNIKGNAAKFAVLKVAFPHLCTDEAIQQRIDADIRSIPANVDANAQLNHKCIYSLLQFLVIANIDNKEKRKAFNDPARIRKTMEGIIKSAKYDAKVKNWIVQYLSDKTKADGTGESSNYENQGWTTYYWQTYLTYGFFEFPHKDLLTDEKAVKSKIFWRDRKSSGKKENAQAFDIPL